MKRLMFTCLPLAFAGICYSPSDEAGAGVPPAPPAPTVDPAAEAAAKAAAAAQAKADKEAAKAAAKAKRDADAAAKKTEKETAAAAAKATKEAEKQAKIDAKAKAKADAEAAKDAGKMPEQNGVRRPKPDTLCGKAWAIFDTVSTKNGSPASIGESMDIAKAQGLNEANVRAEYARWRKFYNLSGRITAPKAVETPAPTVPGPIEGAGEGVVPTPNEDVPA